MSHTNACAMSLAFLSMMTIDKTLFVFGFRPELSTEPGGICNDSRKKEENIENEYFICEDK